MKSVPFNWPGILGREREYLQQVASSGQLAGNGPFTRACEALLEQRTSIRRALLTTSCTHALEMAALLMDLDEGDEVIVPSFTFVSTVNAFVLHGARPVFADIRPDTLNLDERQLSSLITPRTRAIVAVHYAGVACEMDEIQRIATGAGVRVIEDNAHGLFGRYRGRPLGSLGDAATLSFHDTKNVTCGEGGALLLHDSAWIDRAEILREKGTNRSRFFRGEIDKYTWVDVGSSYVLSEVLAAFLLGQLEQIDEIQARRQRIFERYQRRLCAWAAEHGVGLPQIPAYCVPAYHLFYLLLPDLATRQRFIAYLKEHSIHAVFHYVPLHLAPAAERWGFRRGSCPVTEATSDRLVRLPFFTTMAEADQDYVIDVICSFRA